MPNIKNIFHKCFFVPIHQVILGSAAEAEIGEAQREAGETPGAVVVSASAVTTKIVGYALNAISAMIVKLTAFVEMNAVAQVAALRPFQIP